MSRYLVTDGDGNGHLPVRDTDSGPLNHHLMGAAWAALHGGYRGNKYQGSDKEKAIVKLKALYKSEGMALPSEASSESRMANRGPGRIAVLLQGIGKPTEVAGKATHEIPICVTGTWVKNDHRFSITAEDLADMVRNFEKRDNHMVVIDYEHASEQPDVAKGGPVPAAGWIHRLQIGSSGHRAIDSSRTRDGSMARSTDGSILNAFVEWTPLATQLIGGSQYRFFSPAIDWNFPDKETGKSQGATLTSGALTNHPFLEELPPITLTESGVVLADVSTGYLDAPLPGVSVAYPGQGSRKQEARSKNSNGGNMAKKLSMKCAEDGAHQVFDGDDILGEVPHEHLCKYAQTHLADDLGIPADGAPPAKGQAGIPGHQKASELLKDSGFRIQDSGDAEKRVVELLKVAQTHQLVEQREASRNLLLTECLVAQTAGSAVCGPSFNTEKAKQLLRDKKIDATDLLDAIEAKGMLDQAVAAGKVLPKDRGFFFEIAFNNPKKFTEYIAGAVPIVALAVRGLGSTENIPVDQEVMIETKKLMSEKNLSYGKAMKEVFKGNPQLEERYRAAHRDQPRDNTPVVDRGAGITQ